jgi:hypothetical protein
MFSKFASSGEQLSLTKIWIWTPNFGRKYGAALVFNISKNLFETIPYDFSWAIE